MTHVSYRAFRFEESACPMLAEPVFLEATPGLSYLCSWGDPGPAICGGSVNKLVSLWHTRPVPNPVCEHPTGALTLHYTVLSISQTSSHMPEQHLYLALNK